MMVRIINLFNFHVNISAGGASKLSDGRWMLRVIDFDRDKMPIHPLAPYVYKRISYAHEAELRATIQRLLERTFSTRSKRPFIEGIYIPVDLHILVDVIHLAPQISRWQIDLAKSVAARYDLHKPVVASLRDQTPIY